LSALLVSTSKQMPACVQELNARGLKFPVLIGGAAINPSFGRMASYVDQEKSKLYGPGVFYCKDAFDGLDAVEALVDPKKRDEFVAARHRDVIEGDAKRAANIAKGKAMRPASANGAAPSRDVDIPNAPFLGSKRIDKLPVTDLFRFFDLNTLYRLHWGAKNSKGEEYEKLVKEEFEPRLKKLKQDAIENDWFAPKAVYGYFEAASDGNDIVVFKDDKEVARFETPRQADRDHLALADYLAPIDSGKRDIVALQVVTVGDKLLEKSEAMMKGGDYSEGYYLHGFGVRLAEAAAEYVNREIRNELGLPKERGLRYSWGYPAIPDHMQHHQVFELLPVREQIGVDVTEAGALVPELTTAAIVIHHPEAKYFST
jgi:5-methyltetrahydrofolate--homocysteine methyltransferase